VRTNDDRFGLSFVLTTACSARMTTTDISSSGRLSGSNGLTTMACAVGAGSACTATGAVRITTPVAQAANSQMSRVHTRDLSPNIIGPP
jgi:hypothetical protein